MVQKIESIIDPVSMTCVYPKTFTCVENEMRVRKSLGALTLEIVLLCLFYCVTIMKDIANTNLLKLYFILVQFGEDACRRPQHPIQSDVYCTVCGYEGDLFLFGLVCLKPHTPHMHIYCKVEASTIPAQYSEKSANSMLKPTWLQNPDQ